MKNLRLFFLAVIFFFVSGCAWQRIPAPPEYTFEEPIPLKVGVMLADNKESSYYGPAVIKEWNEMRLFNSLVYPLRDSDPVDAVIMVTISGGWKGSGGAAGFITGLTLGLAGTVVGPSLTGTHDTLATLNRFSSQIGWYSVQVTTSVEWGMAASTSEVAKKADDLQGKRIASELAKLIRADRQTLLRKVK